MIHYWRPLDLNSSLCGKGDESNIVTNSEMVTCPSCACALSQVSR